MLSLKQAAEETGKGKPAILKAIQKGRLSAKKNDKGQWEIDPSELFRAYPKVSGNGSNGNASEQQETHKETNNLQREIDILREKLGKAESERERERRLLENVIDDLREDRDKWRQQATALLTHEQEKPPVKVGWFDRLLGRA